MTRIGTTHCGSNIVRRICPLSTIRYGLTGTLNRGQSRVLDTMAVQLHLVDLAASRNLRCAMCFNAKRLPRKHLVVIGTASFQVMSLSCWGKRAKIEQDMKEVTGQPVTITVLLRFQDVPLSRQNWHCVKGLGLVVTEYECESWVSKTTMHRQPVLQAEPLHGRSLAGNPVRGSRIDASILDRRNRKNRTTSRLLGRPVRGGQIYGSIANERSGARSTVPI